MRTPPHRARYRALVSGLMVAALLAGCGEQAAQPQASDTDDTGPIHVHGLGVNPADGALFVATHTGLFRAADGESKARRVADRYQDTMGFAVVGPNRFLGSGHPDLQEKLPPYLGLIESRDSGESWRPVSLQGKVDFHILRAGGNRVYGYGSDFQSREPRFLASTDGGRRWTHLRAPEPLVSLVVSPGDPRRLMAAGERGIHFSGDGGRSWSQLGTPAVGLLAWTTEGMYLVDANGRVWRSTRETPPWKGVGSIGGKPAAFEVGRADTLLVALHDGTIKQSRDGGMNWTVRSQPG